MLSHGWHVIKSVFMQLEGDISLSVCLSLLRTETVVEKLLTNWMSICLYAFLRVSLNWECLEHQLLQMLPLSHGSLSLPFSGQDSAGEPLYMLFRAIKHQVDKGPVDTVTGKAKYTLNDNRLLREDIEYHTLVQLLWLFRAPGHVGGGGGLVYDLFFFIKSLPESLPVPSYQTVNVLMQGGGSATESQPVAAKVLDCDIITQVKEKILDQVYKGTSFSHRPHADSLDLGKPWESMGGGGTQ